MENSKNGNRKTVVKIVFDALFENMVARKQFFVSDFRDFTHKPLYKICLISLVLILYGPTRQKNYGNSRLSRSSADMVTFGGEHLCLAYRVEKHSILYQKSVPTNQFLIKTWSLCVKANGQIWFGKMVDRLVCFCHFAQLYKKKKDKSWNFLIIFFQNNFDKVFKTKKKGPNDSGFLLQRQSAAEKDNEESTEYKEEGKEDKEESEEVHQPKPARLASCGMVRWSIVDWLHWDGRSRLKTHLALHDGDFTIFKCFLQTFCSTSAWQSKSKTFYSFCPLYI